MAGPRRSVNAGKWCQGADGGSLRVQIQGKDRRRAARPLQRAKATDLQRAGEGCPDSRFPPASASPVPATGALADSLASATPRSCAGPRCSSGLWPGQLRAAPPAPLRCAGPHARTPRPRALRQEAITPARESGQLLLRQRPPSPRHRLRSIARPHWRPQDQSHLWPSVFRARPSGLAAQPHSTPRPPSHGPPLHAPGQTWEHRAPAPRGQEPKAAWDAPRSLLRLVLKAGGPPQEIGQSNLWRALARPARPAA
jgi:hypothetical protein